MSDEPALSPRTEKVRKVMTDIVYAERSYVDNLHLLVAKFVKPMKEMARKGDIEYEKVQRIFVNVEGIANFHDILLADLEADQQQNKDDAAGMANTFLAHADFLKMYTQYVNGYDRCCDTVDSLKGHKKFQSLLRSARSDKACKGNNLMSFLIMPVQRIPVYTLLLERLLRAHMSRRSSAEPPATTDEPTVVDKLQQALDKITQIATYVNENKRRAEDRSKLLDLRSRLTGGSNFTLITPTRRLIMDGEVQKLSMLRLKRSIRLFLFNDMLLWSTQSYKIRGHIDLARAILTETYAEASSTETTPEVKSIRKKPHGPKGRRTSNTLEGKGRGRLEPLAVEVTFEVVHPDKTLVLVVESRQQKKMWMKALGQCIKESIEQEMDIHLRRERALDPAQAEAQSVSHFLAQQQLEEVLRRRAADRDSVVPAFPHIRGGSSDPHMSIDISIATDVTAPDTEQQADTEGSTQVQTVHTVHTGQTRQPLSPPVSHDPASPSPAVWEGKLGETDDLSSTLTFGTDPDDEERRQALGALHTVLAKTFKETAVKALDQAVDALRCLSEKDINTLRSGPARMQGIEETAYDETVEPPIVVKKVLEAVTVALGVQPRRRQGRRPDYWKMARKLVHQPHFLTLIKAHSDKRLRIPDDKLTVLKTYITNPLLQPKAVGDLNYAAGVLWNWVRANYSAQSGHKLALVLPQQQMRRQSSDDSPPALMMPSQSFTAPSRPRKLKHDTSEQVLKRVRRKTRDQKTLDGRHSSRKRAKSAKPRNRTLTSRSASHSQNPSDNESESEISELSTDRSQERSARRKKKRATTPSREKRSTTPSKKATRRVPQKGRVSATPAAKTRRR